MKKEIKKQEIDLSTIPSQLQIPSRCLRIVHKGNAQFLAVVEDSFEEMYGGMLILESTAKGTLLNASAVHAAFLSGKNSPGRIKYFGIDGFNDALRNALFLEGENADSNKEFADGLTACYVQFESVLKVAEQIRKPATKEQLEKARDTFSEKNRKRYEIIERNFKGLFRFEGGKDESKDERLLKTSDS